MNRYGISARRGKFYSALRDELRAFAEKTFELATLEDGVPYRQILEDLLGRTQKPDRRAQFEAELETPPMPDELGYIWNTFCRLSARRRSGFSIEPIGWPDLDAFTRLTGVRLAPFEIQLIEMLDDLFGSKKT